MRRRAGTVSLASVLLVTLSALSRSQEPADGAQTERSPLTTTDAPRSADAASVDAVVAAFYDVISGPAGQPRQWERDRALYVPGVQFVSLGVRSGRPHAVVMDHAAFVETVNDDLVREGFFEREIHRVTRSFGSLTHVFSTYEMRNTEDGPVIGRGVNSLQLFHDGERWWIAGAVWDDERSDDPIPPELLPE